MQASRSELPVPCLVGNDRAPFLTSSPTTRRGAIFQSSDTTLVFRKKPYFKGTARLALGTLILGKCEAFSLGSLILGKAKQQS